MKRTLLLSMVLATCSQLMVAQTTVTGTVVDTKGQPMPGARVQVKGSGESVLTAMDGTFSIMMPNAKSKLQAQYVGWQTATKRGEDGMIIKMRKDSWMKPDQYRWFVALNAAFPEDSPDHLSPGIMFGRAKNFGWYVKGQFNGTVDYAEDEYYRYYDNREWFTGKNKSKYWSISFGGLARIWGPIYVYAGGGYVDRSVYSQFQDGEYMRMRDSYNGVLFEAGLKLRYKRFFLYGGAQGCADETAVEFFGDDWESFVGNFGIGIYF